MITISQDITLTPITFQDQEELFTLMCRIYPSAYGHYWKDGGSWYLNEQYSIDNLQRELIAKGSEYYFVRFRESVIGIFKIIQHCPYPPLPNYNAFKIHRVYLDPQTQGKGIGKALMAFAEGYAQDSGHNLVWLDAMDTHNQAQEFYKGLGYEKSKLQQLDFPLLYDEHRPMWYMHKLL